MAEICVRVLPVAPPQLIQIDALPDGFSNIPCVDGWGLIGRWDPDATHQWSSKSVQWLIEEIAYRSAGITCGFDGSTEWATTIDDFAFHPNLSAGSGGGQGYERRMVSSGAVSGLAALVQVVGGRAYFDSSGVMQCIVPANQSASADYTYGANDEILSAEYGDGLVMPNVIRVVGCGAVTT